MKKKGLYFIIIIFFTITMLNSQTNNFRPAAIPLITNDPYFSIWSISDNLNEDWPRHWTGTINALCGMISIDNAIYRVIGKYQNDLPLMKQVSVNIYPTRTIYTFEKDGVRLILSFMTPALPNDIDNVSKPVTYITWEVKSIDNGDHDVKIYFDNSGESSVNSVDQKVIWSRFNLDKINVLRIGSKDQPVLEKAGDNLRIDWGYLYLCSEADMNSNEVIAGHSISRKTFIKTGDLPKCDDLRSPRAVNDEWPVLAHVYNFGKINKTSKSHFIVLAYDDIFSIQYFYRNLKGYWTKKYHEIQNLIVKSFEEYNFLSEKCKAFDDELLKDLQATGGEKYSLIASLSFRQCLAAHKIAIDIDGRPLMFSKENFSGGCIGTVDVTYPGAPFFLLFNPEMLKAQIIPVFEYAKMERWRFPYAPHDLGFYPLANGQVYGGGDKTEENQMPVEESGNMIIMVAALAKIEKKPDFALKYWDLLTKWADYLLQKGFDPENQLCTDDFAGHLAHNVNLSAKAIIALASYGKLCEMAGKKEDAKKYLEIAKVYSEKWIKLADDGDHFRLAFDKSDSWSQKYNLIWDKLLDLNIFPKKIYEKEIKYYLAKQNEYGLPLDSRKDYTKLDWIIWTASLADKKTDFERFIEPIYKFCNNTTSRVPLTDWYDTKTAKQSGFQARSVVGGVFIKILTNDVIWEKWRSR